MKKMILPFLVAINAAAFGQIQHSLEDEYGPTSAVLAGYGPTFDICVNMEWVFINVPPSWEGIGFADFMTNKVNEHIAMTRVHMVNNGVKFIADDSVAKFSQMVGGVFYEDYLKNKYGNPNQLTFFCLNDATPSSWFANGSTGKGVYWMDVNYTDTNPSLYAHEILHAMGILHTFGFNLGPCGTDTIDGDYIPDTPPESCNCNAAGNCSRNIMSYNDYMDEFTPQQTQCLRYMLRNDSNYIDGMAFANYGIGVRRWVAQCPADLDIAEVSSDCPVKTISITDMAGKQIQYPDAPGLYVYGVSDCHGVHYEKRYFPGIFGN